MQSIQDRLDMLQSKLSLLIRKMEERDHALEELKNENNRLKTSLKDKEEEIIQWRSKANSVSESSHNGENRKIIKAEIEEYVKEIDECIALIKAM